MTPRWVVVAKVFVWAACLAPFAWLAYRVNFRPDLLGANPVEQILEVCGKTALNLLMLTLCVTPLRRLTGVNRLISFRRLLGLFAFFYVVLHFSSYALLDLGLQWGILLEDIAERPYITVGFTGLVLLVPLVVTSTQAMQRRLGRNWVKLHRLVYVVAVLGVVHYWWQVKLDTSEPLIYAVLLALLFAARLLHRRLVHAKAAMAAANQRIEPPQTPLETRRPARRRRPRRPRSAATRAGRPRNVPRTHGSQPSGARGSPRSRPSTPSRPGTARSRGRAPARRRAARSSRPWRPLRPRRPSPRARQYARPRAPS